MNAPEAEEHFRRQVWPETREIINTMNNNVTKTSGVSDGTTADYYKLPAGASELQHLISFLNLNAQMGEIMRSAYRYGKASHSDCLRDINKIIFYAKAEKERLEKYVLR